MKRRNLSRTGKGLIVAIVLTLLLTSVKLGFTLAEEEGNVYKWKGTLYAGNSMIIDGFESTGIVLVLTSNQDVEDAKVKIIRFEGNVFEIKANPKLENAGFEAIVQFYTDDSVLYVLENGQWVAVETGVGEDHNGRYLWTETNHFSRWCSS
ncbi:MAG: hypothetical protein ACE5HW_01245 [Candidatus Methanofastidiosia archaeon]